MKFHNYTRDLIKLQNQFINFSFIGGFGVLVNWLLFSYLKTAYNLSTFICSVVFYFFVLIVIFPLQKIITFKKTASPVNTEFLKFFLNHTSYIIIDFGLSYFFVDYLNLPPILGKFFSLLIMTPLSFISQKYWVFQDYVKKGILK